MFVCMVAVGIMASTLENLSSGFPNNKNADQSAHTRLLISDLLFAFEANHIYKHTKEEISTF